MTLNESKQFARWMLGWVLFGILVAALASRMPVGRDSSDPPGARSGIMVRTDALSGCQYLVAPEGGITPRMDAHGVQICGVRQ